MLYVMHLQLFIHYYFIRAGSLYSPLLRQPRNANKRTHTHTVRKMIIPFIQCRLFWIGGLSGKLSNFTRANSLQLSHLFYESARLTYMSRCLVQWFARIIHSTVCTHHRRNVTYDACAVCNSQYAYIPCRFDAVAFHHKYKMCAVRVCNVYIVHIHTK